MDNSNNQGCFAIDAERAPARETASHYPAVFAARMSGRIKQPLGDLFGLKNFGVNFTTLLPGGVTALHHRHLKQDEFIYVLKGKPTLYADDGEIVLVPGMCAGFPAAGVAHHLENRTAEIVMLLEIGDRSPDDEVMYPHDDLLAEKGQDGSWLFFRKDKTPY